MALSQKRYIDIASGVLTSPLNQRSLGGMVITKSVVKDSSGNTVEGAPVAMSLKEAIACFGGSSPEVSFATAYYSYAAPETGNLPVKLQFFHWGNKPNARQIDEDTGELEAVTYSNTPMTAAEAFAALIDVTDNFGSFCFIEEEGTVLTNADILAVSALNNENKFLFVCRVDAQYSTELAGMNAKKGCIAIRGRGNSYVSHIPMAWFAAIDYDGKNTASCLMFKQFPYGPQSETSGLITDDSEADALDLANVNYYGQTQANGQKLAFFQRGFNTDGTDTAVYCNEIWLKSHIATDFLNLLVTRTRIPANDVGASTCRGVISAVAEQALVNGVIMPGTTLTQTQRNTVTELSGDPEAYAEIETQGYWLDVVVKQDGNNFYAQYVLIYRKGDSIRKIQGNDILV